MDLALNRNQFSQDGVFGTLEDMTGKQIAVTLEHAYAGTSSWISKIPDGKYACVRGQHQLLGMSQPFETFMILNVPNHTGILFHTGNYNEDSDGCVLVGDTVTTVNGARAISSSRLTFAEFMEIQDGVESFDLTVTSTR